METPGQRQAATTGRQPVHEKGASATLAWCGARPHAQKPHEGLAPGGGWPRARNGWPGQPPTPRSKRRDPEARGLVLNPRLRRALRGTPLGSKQSARPTSRGGGAVVAAGRGWGPRQRIGAAPRSKAGAVAGLRPARFGWDYTGLGGGALVAGRLASSPPRYRGPTSQPASFPGLSLA